MSLPNPEQWSEPALTYDQFSLFNGFYDRLVDIRQKSAADVNRPPMPKKFENGTYSTWSHRISSTHPTVIFGDETQGDIRRFLLQDVFVAEPTLPSRANAIGSYVVGFVGDRAVATQYNLAIGHVLPCYGQAVPNYSPEMPTPIAGCEQEVFDELTTKINSIWTQGPFTGHRLGQFVNLINVLENHLGSN